MSNASSTREAALTRSAEPFDLIVVGGGCNGAGTAWDAAARGMRVLLLEKEDVGWATSAWNSRLIHGGLKYLEKYDVRLVRESLREREWLLRAAPHLVKPLRFVLPFYQRNAHPALVLRAGMVAYDVLSWDKSLPRHEVHDPDAALAIIPGLDADGLQGAAAYYDGQVELAERLSVEIALAAIAAGAVVLNHARAARILRSEGRVSGVEFVDELTGTTYAAHAPVVVNAAGPWVDEVLRGLDDGERVPLMGGTKGTHLIVDPFPGAPVGSAMYYEAITDARPMMIIPWRGRYIIGATDERFTGDLDTASRDEDELAYILRETNLVIPTANLSAQDILWSYTGVRPLPYQASGPTSDITRRHIVKDHGRDKDRPVPGLYSVIGGKLTTFRALATDVNDLILGRAARRRPTTTRGRRFPGAQARDLDDFATWFRGWAGLPPGVADRLLRVYGTRAARVVERARADGAVRVLDSAPDILAAEVGFVMVGEFAATLGDVVARRILTGLDPDLGVESLGEVGEIAAAVGGWDGDRLAAEIADYRAYIEKFHPVRVPAGPDA